MVTDASAAVSVINGRSELRPQGKFVMRSAVRASGFTSFADVEIHLGVAVPQCHVGHGAGAVHAAIGI